MDGEQSTNEEVQWRGAETSERAKREIPEAVLRLDPVFDALAHPRRRYLLYALRDDDEPTLRSLARKIAVWEHGATTDAVTDSDVDEVYVSLFHAHVPKLVDSGVVTLEPDDETVVPAEHAEQVQAALSGVGASLDSPQEYHAREDGRDSSHDDSEVQ